MRFSELEEIKQALINILDIIKELHKKVKDKIDLGTVETKDIEIIEGIEQDLDIASGFIDDSIKSIKKR